MKDGGEGGTGLASGWMKMAEGSARPRVDCEKKAGRRRKKNVLDNLKKESNECVSKSIEVEEPSLPDCAVCLQPCVYPARLPCSHIFCFLCLKGIACQSRKCAMCRQEIPSDYLEHPDLVLAPSEGKGKDREEQALEGGYQWFYEGRNGWWQYDGRTSREMEAAYKRGDRTCELLIAGFLYVADFDSMLQVRRNEASRVRRIKRDLATIPRKGVAGIRVLATTDSLANQMNSLSVTTSSSSSAPADQEDGGNGVTATAQASARED